MDIIDTWLVKLKIRTGSLNDLSQNGRYFNVG